MPDDPHYFIGIPVPEEMSSQLSEWQDILKPFVDYKVWVHKEDFHITLKFLGAVSSHKLKEVMNMLLTLNKYHLTEIRLNSVNFFGKEEQPRVMYAEVEKDEALNALKKEIEEKMKILGFLEDKRPYKPHITLAKKWRKGKLYTSKEVLDDKLSHVNFSDFLISHFHLYQVQPNQLPKYKVIQTFEIM